MKGYYTGYSPSILPRASADKYLAALKSGKTDCACKNVSSMGNSLIKDVPDPVVLSVSLTRQPCLHESKFCEVNNMEEEMSLKSKILTAMGMSEEAEVIALKSQVTTLEEKIDTMQTEFKEALKAQQEEFKQTLTEALKTAVEEEVVEEEPETTEEEAEVEVEEEVEEEVEDEPAAEKGESKQEPIHDNIAEKSKPFDFYAYMGRTPRGTRKR
jgi:TolA-binding protein